MNDLFSYLIAQADKLNSDWQVHTDDAGTVMLYRKWTGDTTAIFAFVHKKSDDLLDSVIMFTEDIANQPYRKVEADDKSLMSILKEFSK